MWNGNNPQAYSDPTGFLSQAQENMISRYAASVGWNSDPSHIACTDYVKGVLFNLLGIDLRSMVGQGLNLLNYKEQGYNHHGWFNGNWAGNVGNLMQYFQRQSEFQHAALQQGGYKPGDLLFFSGPAGDKDHTVMVGQVDPTTGAILSIIESTGEGNTGAVNFRDFLKRVEDQGLHYLGFGRIEENAHGAQTYMGDMFDMVAVGDFIGGLDPGGGLGSNEGSGSGTGSKPE